MNKAYKTLMTFVLGMAACLLHAAQPLALDGGTFDLAGADTTVGALSSTNANSAIVNTGAPATLTIGADDAESSFLGSIGANIRLVKTGAGRIDLGTSTLAVSAVEVQGGTLRIAQTKTTSARYLRFTPRAKNPWRTQNAGTMTQMGYFGVTLANADVAYPAGTTAVNSDNTDASKILTVGHSEATDWSVNYWPVYVTIDMGANVVFDGYRIAAATISSGRTPYAFSVDVGVDGAEGIDWYRFDDQETFCTAGYGRDMVDGTWGYGPRMDPVNCLNPIPVFPASASVSIASGATLELDRVSGRVPNLSGAGTLKLAGSRPEFTGAFTFTGLVDGFGAVTFAMDNAVVPAFRFASTAFYLYNTGAARTWTLAGTAENPAAMPLAFDSAAAPLSLDMRGNIRCRRMPTLVDRFENPVANALHGTVDWAGATVDYPETAPTVARFIRYAPISGTSTKVSQTAELEFSLDGEFIAVPPVLHGFYDGYMTTNYTGGSLSDQNAYGYSHEITTYRNLLDGATNNYCQVNIQNEFGTGVRDSPALTMTLDGMTTFDYFGVRVPSFSNAPNPAYWAGKWALESSLDGITWEVVNVNYETFDFQALYGWPPRDHDADVQGPLPGAETLPSFEGNRISGAFDSTGAFQYIRIRVTEISGGNSGAGEGVMLQLSELEINKNGEKVPWPAGTVAYRADGLKTPAAGLIDATARMPSEEWNGYDANKAVGGAMATWGGLDAASVANGYAFVIELGGPVDFDQYRLFCGDNVQGLKRCVTKWTLDVSFDGATYHPIDSADLYGSWNGNVYMGHTFFYKKAVDLSAVAAVESFDAFRDDRVLELGPAADYTMAHAAETVGGLDGAGGIAMSGFSVLTLNGVDPDAVFSGAITGDGTLVVAGGTNVFDNADLSGVRRIVLKDGARIAGTADFGGGDLTVESEGGEWAAAFSGIGAFALEGDPLAMVADNATAQERTCFAYASTDAASKALFRASVVDPDLANHFSVSLRATDTSMRFALSAPATLLIIR